MASGLDNKTTLGSLYVMGTKIKADLRDAITSAEISMSTSQVTQLTIKLIDTDFKILKQNLFHIGIPVRYKDLHFVVSNVETSSMAGNEAVTIKCRPETVQKLKNRKGSKVMKNASPSEFVISECKAVGARYYVQPSAKRSSIARDKPKSGEDYEKDEYPSSWTTFLRLADELGYAVFEMAGVIYFGKPTYFLNAGKKTPIHVTWNTGGSATMAEMVPECVKSVDSRSTTIRVVLPLERAQGCRIGRVMKLTGVPYFDGYYLVDSVDYSLSGNSNRVQLTASTAINPEANPDKIETTKTGKDGTIYKIVTGTSKGSWPLERKYRPTTPFGQRGSWSAGYHTGVDFSAPIGAPVYAVYAGTVQIGGWGSAYGKHVVLKVGSKHFAYCHLSSIKVTNGQTVRSGQILGYVGNTGRAFGFHLHLEYRVSPYRYGTDSRDPLPQLLKSIKVKKKVAIGYKYPAGSKTSKKTSDFVTKALSRVGSRYVFGATRDTSNPNQREFDCSSLVRWALAQVGISDFPATTFSQQSYLKRKGKKISIEQAYRTRGALLYRSTGSDHVAISLGNGKSVEALSRSLGIRTMNSKGRGWTAAYLIPGLRY